MNKMTLKSILFIGISSTLCMRIYDQRQREIAKGEHTEDNALVDALICFGSIPARTVRAYTRHISELLDSDEKLRARQRDGVDSIG